MATTSVQVRVDGGQPLDRPHEVVIEGWTEEEYFRLAPEDRGCEFVHGRVIVSSPVTERHDAITGFLDSICGPYLKHRKMGVAHGEPFTMRLEPGLDREPDLFCVLEAHRPRIEKNYLDGPADLVVEVVSTESRRRDLQEKPEEYARHGVPEYWVVDHERRALHRHRLEGAAYRVEVLASGTIEPAAFPGLRIEVGWLWQDPLPDEYTILRQLLG